MSDGPSFSAWLETEGPAITATDTPRLLKPGDILDGWRVISFIANGGNAEVYRAEHVTLKTVAAIKISIRDTAEANTRFKLEAQILGDIRHDALPAFHAFGQYDGHAFIITEHLRPLDLPRTDRSIASFAIRLAQCLDVLHDRGIVHRDLKPGNLMTRNGRDPVLVDLGYAKRIAPADAKRQSLSIEQSRLVGLGTPGYAAPEQFTGETITPAADIHALGVLLNECFDRKPPRQWQRIIAKCTSSLPEYRFRTAGEFIASVRRRNLRRTLFKVFAAVILTGLIAALVIIPTVIREREREQALEAERQRREEEIRLGQESIMREIQLIMDEK